MYPLPGGLCSREARCLLGQLLGFPEITNKGVDAGREPRGPIRQVLQELREGDVARRPRSWSCWCPRGAALAWPVLPAVPVPAGSGQEEAASLDHRVGCAGMSLECRAALRPSGPRPPRVGQGKTTVCGAGAEDDFHPEGAQAWEARSLRSPRLSASPPRTGPPLCKAGEHQCHCPGQELIPRTTQSPSKG